MESEHEPLFSVIIPARNEADYIEATIRSVQAQKTRVPYEIIVVDNGSVDATAEVATQTGVQVVHELVAGLPRARECGRTAAKGKYLLYIDADTTMPPHYIERVHGLLRKKQGVVGVTNPFWFYDGSIAQNILVFIYFNLFYKLQTLMLTMLGSSNQFIGGSFTVEAAILEKAGGFNTDFDFFGEDTELSKRVGKHGKIAFLSSLRVATSARRFKINGTLKTTIVYVRNYFSVALFNHEADNVLGRSVLKTVFILSSMLLVEIIGFRYFHHFAGQAHAYASYWAARLDEHEAQLSAIILTLAGVSFAALVSPRVQLFGPTVNRMNTSERLVALTFDDGPSASATDRVLAILAKHKIRASFFMTGAQADLHPEIVRSVVKAKHSVAVHSYRHNWLLPFQTKRSIAHDLRRAEKALQAIDPGLLRSGKYYRPPHGWRTPWMLRAVRESGYTPVLWNVITRDFRERMPASAISRSVLRQVKPGSIIVLHDCVAENPEASRDNMVAALPVIITKLKEQNYHFVCLEDMLG